MIVERSPESSCSHLGRSRLTGDASEPVNEGNLRKEVSEQIIMAPLEARFFGRKLCPFFFLCTAFGLQVSCGKRCRLKGGNITLSGEDDDATVEPL